MSVAQRVSLQEFVNEMTDILDNYQSMSIRVEGYPLQDTSTVTYEIKPYGSKLTK